VDEIPFTLEYVLLSSPSRIELSGSDCWRVRVRWLPRSFARVSYGILPRNNTLLFIIITVDIKRYRSSHGCRGPLSHTNGRANGYWSVVGTQSTESADGKNRKNYDRESKKIKEFNASKYNNDLLLRLWLCHYQREYDFYIFYQFFNYVIIIIIIIIRNIVDVTRSSWKFRTDRRDPRRQVWSTDRLAVCA